MVAGVHLAEALQGAQEEAGAPDAAVETLTSLLADQPQFFRGQVQLAELYEHQRRWPQAAAAWAKVQSINPRNTEVATRRASALVNAGKAAEATARALQAAHPEDVRPAYLLAQMLDARGRYQDVVDLLKPEIARQKAAKTRGPEIAMLLGSQGLALQQLRRYDEALAVFKEGIDLAPDEPVRHVLLIQGYSAAGRHKDALETAEKARAKFPEDTTVLYQLGAALDRANRRPEAEKVLRDLIARDPLDSGALNYLGYMLAEHGLALDEAVGFIQRALTLEPGNPSFLDSLGWAYVQQGKLDLADPPLSTAAEKLPKNSVIQDHLGDLRQKQNRPAEAVAAWQKALAGDGDALDRAKVQKKIEAAKKVR